MAIAEGDLNKGLGSLHSALLVPKGYSLDLVPMKGKDGHKLLVPFSEQGLEHGLGFLFVCLLPGGWGGGESRILLMPIKCCYYYFF